MKSLYKAWVEYVKKILFLAPARGSIRAPRAPLVGPMQFTFWDFPEARLGKLWIQSQMPSGHVNRLRAWVSSTTRTSC